MTVSKVNSARSKTMTHLTRSFFSQPTRQLAQALIGCRLVRRFNGQRLSGMIVETEAYISEKDLACHARHGRTARTEVMYGPAGRAYVYFTYGMHWMLNIASEPENFPAAVLIRAIEPIEGVEIMSAHRNARPLKQLGSGPAKLTQALQIDRSFNGVDLCDRTAELWLEPDRSISARSIARGPRIGLDATPEPWLSKPWRFWLKNNPFVSK